MQYVHYTPDIPDVVMALFAVGVICVAWIVWNDLWKDRLMKSRHCEPNLLPETTVESRAYLASTATLFIGIFFIVIGLVSDCLAGAPQFLKAHLTIWWLIGVSSFLLGFCVLVLTSHHQKQRTQEAAEKAPSGVNQPNP
jgi:hypothetical protein